jgi:hypothetical protein
MHKTIGRLAIEVATECARAGMADVAVRCDPKYHFQALSLEEPKQERANGPSLLLQKEVDGLSLRETFSNGLPFPHLLFR